MSDETKKDALVNKVVQGLLETDAMTPNHDGTPDYYIVEAENVEYWVCTILTLAAETVTAGDGANDREALAKELSDAPILIGWRHGWLLMLAKYLLDSDWLAARDERIQTEAKAEAWDEGLAAWRTYLRDGQVPPNPYRAGQRSVES